MVSIACLGTMTFGQQNTEDEAVEQLNYAVHEAGINFIDTAELYPVPPSSKTCGSTEEIIGRWLARGGPELRKKIYLASKVSGYSNRGYLYANRKVPRQQILEACDASLRRLQTNYLDLYQLHWPERYTPGFGALAYQRCLERVDSVPIEEQVAAMGELIKQGKIRYWGISNENAFGVAKFVMAAEKLQVPLPVSIQNDFCTIDRRFEQDGTAEACSPLNAPPHGISLLAYGPLAGGTLSGKYSTGLWDLSSSRHTLFPLFQPRYHAKNAIEFAKQHADIAAKYGITSSQLALAWAAAREYMGSVIIGATTMDQVTLLLAGTGR
ncbi:hypothetical protein GUITHDRAFT_80744 [Guillardia theta CCMP2712]|uniref:NADP-dependent oxidoreductase domain-containing protein n=1 Tax=Guillardia theta (strain CCMP2712) TaxID=905079 RepID=L1ID84_GUITC|nr:hypothetical protein GUITHDRAFT_80744 [Guillardia theta CCMP2712]EKX34216.1 hypothetical protein GUITHDRAFT_80744 [Guillardia theta CCMP2712]|eukprot:XP_005821196.1 hypothetical protein GUITHDRAFT_80744 [Guillardia theta CCMP2712]